MITIKEIALLSGVSPTTVSNVIHGKTAHVSPETEKQIRSLLKKHNYVQNMGLRTLAKKNSNIIGIVACTHNHSSHPLLSSLFYSRIIGEMEQLIHTKGCYTMLHCSQNVEDLHYMVSGWNVDGVIALSFTGKDYYFLSNATQKPVVAIDLQTSAVSPCYHISTDNIHACCEMGRYLFHNGYDKIKVFLNKNLGLEHARWKGYRLAIMEHNGVSAHSSPYILGDDSEHFEQLVLEQAKYLTSREVWCFHSDETALQALGILNSHHYNVPNDVGIVGFDNINFSAYAVPALTTISQNIIQKAHDAVEMLFQLISGQKPLRNEVILPTELIIRNSTKHFEA